MLQWRFALTPIDRPLLDITDETTREHRIEVPASDSDEVETAVALFGVLVKLIKAAI